MKTEFTVSTMLPAVPETVFRAWLSTEGHSSMTGSPAKVEPRVGGKFTAWDGYITGKTIELKPYSRIVQAWRTTEFPDDSPDSRIEILLETAGKETKLTLIHTTIPDGQAESYEGGWEDSYFKPMREYFSKQSKVL
jgi:activator of HSP90 ATPase